MSTLSFRCPQCHKQHDRVKPEMAGYKVKCQCGHVFRLGDKANRVPGVDRNLAQRKKPAKPAQPAAGRPQPSRSNPHARPNPVARPATRTPSRPEEPPVAELLGEGNLLEPIDLLIPDEMFDDDGVFLAEPVIPLAEADAVLFADAFTEELPPSPVPALGPVQHAAPTRQRGKGLVGQRLASPLGPVVGLVSSVICLLLAVYFLFESVVLTLALWVAPQFGPEPLPEASMLRLLATIYAGLNAVLVATCLTVAVVAIVELVQSRRIVWASKYATIFSGIMLAFLVTSSILLLATAQSIPGPNGSSLDSQRAAGISVSIVFFVLFRCFAPAVLGLVGLIRLIAKI